MEITILENLGKPNKNKRIYTKNCVQNAIDNAKEPIYGQIGMTVDGAISVEMISHMVQNLKIVGDNLVGEITILDRPKGHLLRELMKMDAMTFRPAGIGKTYSEDFVNGWTTISDYDITSINAIVRGTEA